MKRKYSFQKAPRCSATSKRTRERCKAPAVRGWSVCRFHGAHGGAPKGKANGAYKHGLHTKEAREERRLLSDLLRQSRKAIAGPPCEEEQ
jgi:hypothetical protein